MKNGAALACRPEERNAHENLETLNACTADGKPFLARAANRHVPLQTPLSARGDPTPWLGWENSNSEMSLYKRLKGLAELLGFPEYFRT
jgi:hypothetical protein